MIWVKTLSTPSPLFALMNMCLSASNPNVVSICSEVASGDACSRSTLLITASKVRSASNAT